MTCRVRPNSVHFMVAALGALLTAGCAAIIPTANAPLASATMRSAAGVPIGTATLYAAGDRVSVSMMTNGLTPGIHGIHLHAVGRCDPPGYSSAGPHLNPRARQHGSLNPAGTHLGDMPNLISNDSGAARLDFTIVGERTAIESDVFDADGTAIIVHADADDYRTDPSGNSGSRIACGVLTRR